MAPFWQSTSHFILITGGASGIGFGLAKRLAARGNTVAICGRRLEQLEQAQKECPSLIIIQGDVSNETNRKILVEKIKADFPEINVLINNAGIQNRLVPLTDPSHGDALWSKHKEEIGINFEAPMHLAYLLLPLLSAKPRSQIINVTSGLSFVPIAMMATYCATKAALHSFTLSLRHQLASTSVSVVEIIPPAVNTDLGGPGLHTFGENLDSFCDHVLGKMEESDDNNEIGYKMSETMRLATVEQKAGAFAALNGTHH